MESEESYATKEKGKELDKHLKKALKKAVEEVEIKTGVFSSEIKKH